MRPMPPTSIPTFLTAAALLLPALALAVPLEFSHQGRLFDGTGLAVDGTHDLNVYLYDAPAGGAVVWTQNYSLTFDNGYFSVMLGEDVNGDSLTPNLVDGDIWVTLGIDAGPELPGRNKLVSVPYALLSDTSTNVNGGVVDASEIRVNGTTVFDADGNLTNTSVNYGDLSGAPETVGGLSCTASQIAVYDGGAWQCSDANGHNHDAAQLDTGTIDLARLPIGTDSSSISAGDHVHAFGTLTGVVGLSQLPTGVGGDQVALGDHSHAPGDAETLDGVDSTGFATSAHSHARGDADTLDGLDSAEFAATAHNHAAGDTTSGVFAVSLIPDLDGGKITAGTVATARLDTGTGAAQVALGDHAHTAADVGAMPETGGSFAGDVTVDGTLTVPDGEIADIRDFNWTSQDTLAQIQAQAICTAMAGTGWTFAVPKACSNGRTCAQECAGLSDSQAGTVSCFNSLHVYGNQPSSGTGALGLKVYKYGSCGGGCGPNFCCCSR